MRDYSANDIIKALDRLGHLTFLRDREPYNLNLVWIRTAEPEVNKFKCMLHVFWKHEGHMNHVSMQGTTLPGLYYMKRPLNPKGTGIVAEGQHRGALKVGLHRGYEALVQASDIPVYRDNDKDVEYDLIKKNIEVAPPSSGFNLHRAHDKHELETVGRYSAGCRVVQHPKDFDLLMFIAKEAKDVWGNSFTETIINEKHM